MDIPPLPSVTGIWPIIWFIGVSVLPALWAAFLTFKTKQVDQRAKHATDRLERNSQIAIEHHKLEVEKAVQEYNLRKEFQTDLLEECSKLRLECERLRDSNAKLLGVIIEKDILIRTLTDEKEALKVELAAMKVRIDTLETHIRSLEETRRKNSELI